MGDYKFFEIFFFPIACKPLVCILPRSAISSDLFENSL